MRRHPRALRMVRIMTVGIGVLTFLILATIQEEQYLQRRRSERILRELQSVDLRVTTFSDVESGFGRLATKSATCDKGFCDYSIQLESPLGWQKWIILA